MAFYSKKLRSLGCTPRYLQDDINFTRNGAEMTKLWSNKKLCSKLHVMTVHALFVTISIDTDAELKLKATDMIERHRCTYIIKFIATIRRDSAQTTSTKLAGNIPSLPSSFPVHLHGND